MFTLNYISYSHLIIYIDFKEANSTYMKSQIYHALHSEIASEVFHFKENSDLSNNNQIQCSWNRRSQTRDKINSTCWVLWEAHKLWGGREDLQQVWCNAHLHVLSVLSASLAFLFLSVCPSVSQEAPQTCCWTAFPQSTHAQCHTLWPFKKKKMIF